MKPMIHPVFKEIPLYPCVPPARKCRTENCSNDALSLGPYCDDCDTEMRWSFPGIWRKRMREFHNNP